MHIGFDDVWRTKLKLEVIAFSCLHVMSLHGLNQIYSLRYGAIPIVRATGGLKDTVTSFNVTTGEGTGFAFQEASGEALFTAVNEAVAVFSNQTAWRGLMRNAMAQDFSWRESATRSVALYQRTVASRRRA